MYSELLADLTYDQLHTELENKKKAYSDAVEKHLRGEKVGSLSQMMGEIWEAEKRFCAKNLLSMFEYVTDKFIYGVMRKELSTSYVFSLHALNNEIGLPYTLGYNISKVLDLTIVDTPNDFYIKRKGSGATIMRDTVEELSTALYGDSKALIFYKV